MALLILSIKVEGNNRHSIPDSMTELRIGNQQIQIKDNLKVLKIKYININ